MISKISETVKGDVGKPQKYILLLLSLGLVALFLYFFQILLFSGIFPIEYFALIRSEQTFSAWFFSSYVHYDGNHLSGNLGLWVFGSLSLCFITYLRDIKGKEFPKYYFILVFSILLLVFPFILSFVSIVFTHYDSMLGFSGIAFGLWGVLIYSVFSLRMFCKGKWGVFFVGVLSFILLILPFVFSVYYQSSSMATNHLGHIVGFVLGFIVACICESSLKKRELIRKGV